MMKETYRKQDCGEQVFTSEFRSAQLKMLDVFTEYCDKHGLRYYLSGGTLLGAIRHKGYIPWDDDIDVNMPRPDLNRLLEMTGGQLNGYVFDGCDVDNCMPGCQWMRLCDENTIVESFLGGATDEPIYEPLFIDIFPIDGFPDSEKESRCYSNQLKFIRSMLGVSLHRNVIAINKKRYLAHILMYIPAHVLGKVRLSAMFQKLAKRYDFDKCEYVGVTTVVHYLPRERVVKKDYLPQVKLTFEGREYYAPASYDVYLRQLYGDYMKLPPKEKQRSEHVFNMYIRKNAAPDRKG